MDINAILKKNGWLERADFPGVVKWASAQRGEFHSEADLLRAVNAQFGTFDKKVEMRERPANYRLWLAPGLQVDGNAIDQLKTALCLPVAVGGAGMPDLHLGYSLPIGGVVVLDHAISPAFVGYDISCMMMLSVLGKEQIDPEQLEKERVRQKFLDWVLDSTSFGLGSATGGLEHKVMSSPTWKEVNFVKSLKDLAATQLGSSGSGNHFADIVQGRYASGERQGETFTGLLTHSGSRGVGNKVGHHYSELADHSAGKKYKFPKGYGWFDLDSDLGREYQAVMELMGQYAQANHELIHARFLKVSGLERKQVISNQHNFAWEDAEGRVYHRKGATPAHAGQMGIIPGSSGSESYWVRGKGNPDSWYSASHGAGRRFSRSEAKRRFVPGDFEKHMRKQQITYHGVAADETIAAYKDIQQVIEAQQDLVEVVAVMVPKVVVMGGTSHADDGD
jgi:tRNA-splicing ligase RtcB